MNILFDIVHPAHVHFFKNIITSLEKQNHQTLIIAREKDVTTNLLDAYGFEYVTATSASNKNRLSQLSELIRRDLAIYRLGKKFKADIVLTRNPSGVQAARLLGVPGVFDTDSGRAVGVHFKAAAPFANIITSPYCLDEDYGEKHVKYPGFKQSAYLHPDHFIPDPKVHDLLGISKEEPYFIVRFVSMSASHDIGETGFRENTKDRIVEMLTAKGKVFISCEGEVPDKWKPLQINIPSEKMHDVLNYASLLIGDSQTMALEAGYLGTPNIHVSTFVNRLSVMDELEHKYKLMSCFQPVNEEKILEKLEEYLSGLAVLKENYLASRNKMLSDTENIADWFTENIILKSAKCLVVDINHK